MRLLDDMARFSSPVVLPAIGACVLAYFAYHTVQGDHGIISYMRLSNEVARADSALETLRSTRVDLEHRVGSLGRFTFDLDMLDERVRADLNRIAPDEVVIFLPFDQ